MLRRRSQTALIALLVLLAAGYAQAAVKYVKSGAGGAADGSSWVNAYTTLTAGLAGVTTGDTLYVSHQHVESTAGAVTLTSPGTAAAPVRILCANDGATPPTALAATATVDSTGANNITFNGFAYCYGIKFTAGSAANTASINATSASPFCWRMEQCTLKVGNTSATSRILVGGITGQDDHVLELINSHMEFGATGQFATVGSRLYWQGGSLVNAVIPTNLITAPANTTPGSIEIRDVDLSAATPGTKTLITGTTLQPFEVKLENCKLGASVIISGAPAGPGGARVTLVNCDSADTNYRYAKHLYQGTITNETTIVRTGGASDGTTPVSRKMVSSNAEFFSPLASDPIYIWNDTTGSALTVTAEVVTDNVTLTDAEAWIEVEYLGTSGFPIGSVVSDRAADILATPVNQTSSSVTWTTTGLSTPIKQKLVSPSFTPQEKGVIRARVMIGKATATTMYFCPKLTVE